MNTLPVKPPLTLRLADLADVAEVGMIDAWVLDHPDSMPFHRPIWLTAVEAGTTQQAHMLLAERDADIIAVLPFHLVHSPLFGRALVSSAFGVGGGILSRDASASCYLVREICTLAERWSCPSIELRGGWMPKGARWSVKADAHTSFGRPLQIDDTQELLAIPRKQRAEVRKGLENGFKIEVGSGPRDIDWHYAVYAESVRNLGTPVFPKALME
ncbi:MAG: FemAB, partial [Sphingorhabdus sp.]